MSALNATAAAQAAAEAEAAAELYAYWVETATNLNISRYFTIAGFCVMMWDHVLTLGDEMRLIWKAPSSAPKWIFLIMRYGVPVFVLVHLVQMGGMVNLSNTTLMAIVTIAGGNFLVLLHLWNLWDRKQRLIKWTLLLFVLTQLANFACGIKSIVTISQYTYFVPNVRVCALSNRGNFGILWVPGVVFELVMFFTLVVNGLQRPREQDQAMAYVLYRDGIMYFLLLFSLRLMNTLIAFLAPLSLLFLGVFFIWCTTNLTVTRLILNLRQTIERSRAPKSGDLEFEFNVTPTETEQQSTIESGIRYSNRSTRSIRRSPGGSMS